MTVQTNIAKLSNQRLMEIIEKDYDDYTPEALEYIKEELDNRGLNYEFKVPPKIVCPQCEEEMELGEIYLRASFWGFFFYGFSYKDCFFKSNADNEEIKVVENSKTRSAYHCKNCGYITFKY